MNEDLSLYFVVVGIIWAWVAVFTIRRTHSDPQGSVGLPAAVVLIMSFLYGGAFIYAVPGYSHTRPGANWYLGTLDFSEMMVLKGTIVSLIGLIGFGIGVGAFKKKRRIWRFRPADVSTVPLPSRRYRKRATFVLSMIGILSFLGSYLRLDFPMSHVLFETGRYATVPAIGLGAYLAMREGRSYAGWFGVASLVPAFYIFVWGFTSIGFMFIMAIFGFWMSQLRKPSRSIGKLMSAVTTLGVIWITLTLFVVWFSARDEFRLVVWSGQEGSALGILYAGLRSTEIFSPWNFDALDYLNIRLNMPLFIGKMMELHARMPNLQAWGSTLVILPLVIVPRFLWPGKPERGGTEFISEHTGLTFSDNVTFGSGPVFEFFVNFGYVGVFFGMVLLGMGVRYLDVRASKSLKSGRYLDFMMFMTIGLFAIDPLLTMFFVFNGAVFVAILLTVAKPFLQAWLQKR